MRSGTPVAVATGASLSAEEKRREAATPTKVRRLSLRQIKPPNRNRLPRGAFPLRPAAGEPTHDSISPAHTRHPDIRGSRRCARPRADPHPEPRRARRSLRTAAGGGEALLGGLSRGDGRLLLAPGRADRWCLDPPRGRGDAAGSVDRRGHHRGPLGRPSLSVRGDLAHRERGGRPSGQPDPRALGRVPPRRVAEPLLSGLQPLLLPGGGSARGLLARGGCKDQGLTPLSGWPGRPASRWQGGPRGGGRDDPEAPRRYR